MIRRGTISHLFSTVLARNTLDGDPMPHSISPSYLSPLPELDIQLSPAGFFFDANLTSPVMDLPSFYDRIDDDLVGKLPHDLVLNNLSTVVVNDKPFSHYFERLNDGFDEKSPDSIFLDTNFGDGDQYSILEVGTTRGNLENYYNDKKQTYHDAFKSRSKGRFFILIVGPLSVYTNLPFYNEEVNKIVSDYRYGFKFQTEASRLGWNREENAELTERVKRLNTSMRASPKYQSRCSMFNISESVLEMWKEDVEEHEFNSGMSVDSILSMIKKEPSSFIDYVETVNKSANRPLFDKKPLYYIPGVIPKDEFTLHSGPTEKYIFHGFCSSAPKTDLETLWSLAYDSFLTDYESNPWRDEAEILDRPVGFEEKRDITDANRHIIKSRDRYKLRCDPVLIDHLASRGVNARRSRIDSQSKVDGFSFETDTDDIKRFIMNSTMLETHSNSIEYEKLKGLIDLDEDVSSFYLHYSSSKLGRMTSFISAVSSEMNVNTSKGVGKDEWMILQSRVYRCLILFKNAGGKHYFYSICIPKESYDIVEGPFIPLYSYGDYYITEVYSTRQSDLCMHIGMHSKMFAHYSALREIFSEDWNTTRNPSMFKWLPELLAIFLISMENKEATSSTLMQFRYAYNECVDSRRLTLLDPFKICSKFPVVIRSRLLLFFLKNFEEVFSNIETAIDVERIQSQKDAIDRSTEDDKVDPSHDSVIGFKSFVSLNHLENFGQVLNLMYFGVFHEKSKGESIHGYLKIFTKVCDEEISVRNVRECFSGTRRIMNEFDCSELRSHEFDYRHVNMIGKKLRRSLDIVDPDLFNNIKRKLSNVSFEYFSSMKASADASQFEKELDNLYGTHRNMKRPKCLTEVLRIMSDPNFLSSNPFTHINHLISLVLEMGGVIANLFKKQQLTGVREIFVLTMASRILINFLETVSRCICELIPNEYLTKGDKKLEDLSAHFSKLRRSGKKSTRITISDSLDMTTWCQRFTMPMFGSLFCGFFHNDDEQDLLSVIVTILNMVTDKKLELPTDLLDLFIKHPDEKSMSSESMNELKAQFLGRSENTDLLDKMSVMLKNTSNMMQGILHYTSSVLHAAQLYWVKDKINSWTVSKIDKRYPFIGREKIKISTLTMCSSDDAGRITTVMIDSDVQITPDIEYGIKQILTVTSYYLVNSYSLSGIKVSIPKSTIAVLNWVYEFNSVWYFRNTIMLPLIKWSRACVDYKISNNVTDRMLLDNNCLKDLMKSGSSIFTARCHELSCLINHYDCLGMYSLTSKMWNDLRDNLIEIRHPIVGYYILSKKVVGPILGYDFNLYCHLKENESARKAERYVRQHLNPESQLSESSCVSTSLAFGDLKKYKSFLKNSGIPSREEMCNIIAKSPEHVFGVGVKSKEESRTMIQLNALKPKVSTSFIFQSASNQHRSSVYVYTKPCIRVKIKGKDEAMYYSLRTLCHEVLDYMKDAESDDLGVLFHNSATYDEVIEMCEDLVVTKSFGCRKRQVPLTCNLPMAETVFQIDLKRLLKRVWFGEDNGKSERMCKLVFDRYVLLLPWLKDNVSDSFKEFKLMFPDLDFIHMIDTISSYQNVQKNVSIMHRGPIKRGFLPNIRSMVRFSYSPSLYLCSLGVKEKDQSPSTLDSLLNLMISGPNVSTHSSVMLKRILSTYSSDDMKQGSSIKVIMTAFEMMRGNIKGVISKTDCLRLYEMMRQSKLGVFGWWIRPQRLVGDVWKGLGKYALIIDDLCFVFVLNNDHLLQLECSNPVRAYTQIQIINRVINSVLKLKSVRKTDESGVKVMINSTPNGFSLGQIAPMRSNNLLIRIMSREPEPPEDIYATITLGSDRVQLKIRGNNDKYKGYDCVSLSYRPQSSLDLADFHVSDRYFNSEIVSGNEDLSELSKITLTSSIMSSWMSRQPISPELFPLISKFCVDDPTDELSEWIRQTFICKLKRSGKLPSDMYIDNSVVQRCLEIREEELSIEVSNDESAFDDIMILDDDPEGDIQKFISEVGDTTTVEEDDFFNDQMEELADSSIKTFSEISRYTIKRFRKIELTDGGVFWTSVIDYIEKVLLMHDFSRITWIDSLTGALQRFLLFCSFKKKPIVPLPTGWE